MIRALRVCCLFVLASLTGACATMNQSECRAADWRVIGYEDGAAGREPSTIGRHRKACAEYGVQPDLARYRSGHREGLAEYCTERNGFRQGRAGRDYHDVCPAASEDRFLAAYEIGRELHDIDTELRRLRRELAAGETELAGMEERSANLEKLLVAGALSANERRVQLEQFKELRADMSRQQTRNVELEREIRRLQREYEYLDSRHRY